MVNSPSDNPPAYDTAQVGYDQPPQAKPPSDAKVRPEEQQQYQQQYHQQHPQQQPPFIPYSDFDGQGPSIRPNPYILAPSPNYIPSPQVFHYLNPETGEHVTTLLPPDHPQMICLQQGHVPVTQFGPLGILAAILWFPLGIGLCLLDRKVKCSRCNDYISHGVCD